MPRCRGWCSRPRPASTAQATEALAGDRPAAPRFAVRGVQAGGRAAVPGLREPARRAATSVVALRYFTVYGPRQRPGHGVQPDHARRAVWPGGPAVRYGRPAPGLHLRLRRRGRDDCRSAPPTARAEVVNVGLRPQRAAVQAVRGDRQRSRAPRCRLRRVAQPGDVDATAADLTKARDLLGYQPQVDLAEGLRRQWEWLTAREHPAGSRRWRRRCDAHPDRGLGERAVHRGLPRRAGLGQAGRAARHGRPSRCSARP